MAAMRPCACRLALRKGSPEYEGFRDQAHVLPLYPLTWYASVNSHEGDEHGGGHDEKPNDGHGGDHNAAPDDGHGIRITQSLRLNGLNIRRPILFASLYFVKQRSSLNICASSIRPITVLRAKPAARVICARNRQSAERSLMATGAMLWGGAAYNNGILPFKNYILGEAYTQRWRAGRANICPALAKTGLTDDQKDTRRVRKIRTNA